MASMTLLRFSCGMSDIGWISGVDEPTPGRTAGYGVVGAAGREAAYRLVLLSRNRVMPQTSRSGPPCLTSHWPAKARKKNRRLAGRSANRLMKYGYQAEPKGIY